MASGFATGFMLRGSAGERLGDEHVKRLVTAGTLFTALHVILLHIFAALRSGSRVGCRPVSSRHHKAEVKHESIEGDDWKK